MADKHRQAVELLAELRKTKENIERKSGKVKPDVLYSLLQVRCLTIKQLQLLYILRFMSQTLIDYHIHPEDITLGKL